jgi:20S proteasome alpha/beta subunit
MNDRAGFLVRIPNNMLVGIIKKATDIHSKVAVCLSGIVGDYEYFTVLELAQELAERFPLSKDEVMP